MMTPPSSRNKEQELPYNNLEGAHGHPQLHVQPTVLSKLHANLEAEVKP